MRITQSGHGSSIYSATATKMAPQPPIKTESSLPASLANSSMQRNGVLIVDKFAEAFGMTACRVIVTAINIEWARVAATAARGYGTSVGGCGDCAGTSVIAGSLFVLGNVGL